MRLRRLTAGLIGVPALLLCGTTGQALADSATSTSTSTTGTSTVTLTVAKSGAEYSTVQAAVDAVPDDSATPYLISIAPGSYAERVTVPAAKLHLTLEGASHRAADVVITSADYNQEVNPLTGKAYGTEGSATVHVKANDFTAEYLTFANTFDKTVDPTVTGTQAVAIAMEGDRQQYLHDAFYGHQDTLLSWDSSATTDLRQYVYDSEVSGDVDFIFGNGSLVVDRSTIDALNDGIYSKAYLTAPATPAALSHGILVTGSTVSTTLADNALYLGRAWKPATDSDPQAVFRDTLLPQAVNTAGPWLGISGATWSSGRYGEYGNTGPGAATAASDVRPVLDEAAAADDTAASYLSGADGWDPVAAATAPPPTTGDRRSVSEPRLPSVCRTLTAALTIGKDRLFSAADEAAPPDTARIQAALDACAGTGASVLLTTGRTPGTHPADFLSAPLTVHAGEYLVVGEKATLYATRDATAYQQAGKAVCGSIGSTGTGCNPFVSVNGRDAGVEGTGTGAHQGRIDGRGDLTVLGTTASWWDLAVTAKDEGLKQVNPRLIQSNSADDVTFAHVTLANAAKQHLFIARSIGATVWGVTVDTPANTLNTDGFDLDSSTEATITDSSVMDGDDCVALTTNNAAESQVSVSGLHCYGTHGLSIGSGTTYGLDAIQFTHNTLDGKDIWGNVSSLDNGIRVKSYPGAGGTVTNLSYADTCMTGVQNLIVVTPNYAAPTGTSIPWFKSVTIDGATAVDSVTGATSDLEGYSADYPSGITLRHVHLDATSVTAAYANITLDDTDLSPAGPGVTVTDTGVPDPGHHGHSGGQHCSFPGFPHS
ncbi:pectinesterase family protein [Streptacidiphilus carbonis]|uniref:pectinesterase family protein n=1 Tax=Streptacidiphilus carbonis TaxID=105422 RepID=UPI00069403AC|nr:pectinesterase family protein [Streptacidiphilus carbonis]